MVGGRAHGSGARGRTSVEASVWEKRTGSSSQSDVGRTGDSWAEEGGCEHQSGRVAEARAGEAGRRVLRVLFSPLVILSSRR